MITLSFFSENFNIINWPLGDIGILKMALVQHLAVIRLNFRFESPLRAFRECGAEN